MKAVKLLVIDDDDVDRELIRRLARKIPFVADVVECETASQALKLIPNGGFDCIVLDHRLGTCTGIELIPALKRVSPKPCPIIMITGLGDERVVVEAMREGAYDYLHKSTLQPSALSSAIEGSIRHAALEQRLMDTQARLERQSLHDELTDLPNRVLFFERLDQALKTAKRGGPAFALMMMDLNLFKDVNDSLGHQAGDIVLAEVASRLKGLGRDSDTIARLGGDEFAALLPGTDSEIGAATFAEKILAEVSRPIAIGAQTVSVGISIGVVLSPNHGAERDVLMARADQTMYRAKRSGRGYALFSPQPRSARSRALSTGALLSKAIETREFTLEYQPKIELRTGEVVGAEALARWASPELGPVAPGEFIPLAERTGVIKPLSWYLLELAVQQLQRWNAQGEALHLAVNLSVRLLDDERLPEHMVAMLRRCGLSPGALTLELSETALITQPERALRVAKDLHDKGIRLAIDDFGAGYTSLATLKQLTVSELKIDGGFVGHAPLSHQDVAVIRAICTLAEGLNVQATAEGIEDAAVGDTLVQLGVRFGQGSAIAEPMTADELGLWLTERRSAKTPCPARQ